jgi:hypothetical protein
VVAFEGFQQLAIDIGGFGRALFAMGIDHSWHIVDGDCDGPFWFLSRAWKYEKRKEKNRCCKLLHLFPVTLPRPGDVVWARVLE